MEANELRVGNLVLDKFEKTFKVKEIHYNKKTKRYPIQLTGEWLLKFGFEKYEENESTDWYKREKFKVKLLKEKDIFILAINRLHIKHVHQLQNLYFALTGEELTIK